MDFQLFPQIDNIMVEPLRVARDRYEGMKEQVSTSPNTNEVNTRYLSVNLRVRSMSYAFKKGRLTKAALLVGSCFSLKRTIVTSLLPCFLDLKSHSLFLEIDTSVQLFPKTRWNASVTRNTLFLRTSFNQTI